LNQIKNFRIELVKECSTSLSIFSSLGSNGILLSTIQSQDPLSNICRFVTALESQRGIEKGLFRVGYPDQYEFYGLNRDKYDEISSNEKLNQILNPFSVLGHQAQNTEAWSLGKLLGVSGDTMDEAKVNQALSIIDINLGHCKLSLNVIFFK
jgi:hypothetical protein